MENAIIGACVGAATALLLVAVVLVVRRAVLRDHRTRADLAEMLAAAQHESDLLRQRLDELTAPRDGRPLVTHVPEPRGGTASEPVRADFVITSAGEPEPPLEVPDRLVLTATLGEPLVKVVAFSHGVRRALSAESRNRIWFEMRREVRASRRRRRQLRKRLEREYRAGLRADLGAEVVVETRA